MSGDLQVKESIGVNMAPDSVNTAISATSPASDLGDAAVYGYDGTYAYGALGWWGPSGIQSTGVYGNVNVGTWAGYFAGPVGITGEIQQGGTDYGAYEIQTEGQIYVDDYLLAIGGLHVGGTADPGTDNLVVDGTSTLTGIVSATAVINADATATAISSDGDLVFTGSGDLIDFSDDAGVEKILLYDTIYGIGITANEFNQWADTGADFSWRDTSRTGTEHMELDLTTGDLTLLTGGLIALGCPANFIRTGLGCIQTAEEGTATFDVAVEDCYDTYGGRLPELQELTTAINNYVLTDETDDDEWIEEYYVEGTFTTTFPCSLDANTGTNPSNIDCLSYTFASSVAYRCFIAFGGN